MLVSVVQWFTCYNAVMTSDKFIYLFGRIIPALSLIISMTLRFIPKFNAQLKVVRNAQRCIGRDISTGSNIQKIKNAIKILSIMITWALENAIETADSMKSRGFGSGKRTSFSIYKWEKSQKWMMSILCGFMFGILVCLLKGGMSTQILPEIKIASNISTLVGAGLYTGFLSLPVMIYIVENIKWYILKSKI